MITLNQLKIFLDTTIKDKYYGSVLIKIEDGQIVRVKKEIGYKKDEDLK